MKLRLMDLLACPYDKSWPLAITVFEKNKVDKEVQLPLPNKHTGVICEFYCHYKEEFLVEIGENEEEKKKTMESVQKLVTIEDCQDCHKIELVSAIFHCKQCNRHYPLIEEIPELLPDEIRGDEYSREKAFVEQFKSQIAEAGLLEDAEKTLERALEVYKNQKKNKNKKKEKKKEKSNE